MQDQWLGCLLVCKPVPPSVQACDEATAAESSHWDGRARQEDSMKAQKNIQLAGLFFLGFDTYNVGSKVSPLELQVSPVAITSV